MYNRKMGERLVWLAFVLFVFGCDTTKHPKEGEKVVVGAGDHVIVGSVSVDVESPDDALIVRMHEGTRSDSRYVSGNRIVKFGAHQVRLDENGSRVMIMVRPYKPASPLTSEDALFAADEAMSSKSSGPVECTNPMLTPDGRSYVVDCRDTATTGSNRNVKVDATNGTIMWM